MLHHYFSSVFISFLYFFYRSARNKANTNATGTGFEVKDVRQIKDFKVFESALGSPGGHLNVTWRGGAHFLRVSTTRLGKKFSF